MIGRSIGYAAATAFSACVLTGIGALIVADLFGEELKLWRGARAEPSTPGGANPLLESTRDITFFTTIEAKEHGIAVTTGVSFATIADLLAAKQKNRWCYVHISPRDGLIRQINLGTQSGAAPPVYADLSGYPKEELAVVGLSAGTLQSLAKTHCRFAKSTTRAPSRRGEGQT